MLARILMAAAVVLTTAVPAAISTSEFTAELGDFVIQIDKVVRILVVSPCHDDLVTVADSDEREQFVVRIKIEFEWQTVIGRTPRPTTLDLDAPTCSS